MKVILLISIIANVFLILLHLGKIKDKDKDFIPDSVEDKFGNIKEGVKYRSKRVKEELSDIVGSIKEVGNQIGDLPDAVKGKTRTGRK